MVDLKPGNCLFCGHGKFELIFLYETPPDGEIRFQFSRIDDYYREVWKCSVCGHFSSRHRMTASDMYSEEYVRATYKTADGICEAYEKVLSLDASRSDNSGRVQKVCDFAARHFAFRADGQRRLLDVGSGLCVFPRKMKEAGWVCTAIDPDERCVAHAREIVGVDAVHADFMQVEGLGKFDVITFNKVLEHVADPVTMAARSAHFLETSGLVYVELPDGEAAAADGPGREEFFIDHIHVFSMTSTALLAGLAGFRVQLMERLREPSGKFTIRAFLS